MTAHHGTRTLTTSTLPTTELGMFIESFLNRWEGNSRESYRLGIDIFIDWCTQHSLDPIRDIKRPHLEMYLKYLRDERGNSNSTIAHRMGTVKQFHDIAIDDELINRNPGLRVRIPKVRVDLSKKVSLDRNEMGQFMHFAYKAGASDYALMAVMGYLGLRVSEACSLDVEDVQFVSKAHRCVRVISKGGELALIPQPPVVDARIGCGDR